MTDTFSTNLDLTKPQLNGSDDTWGDKLNANLDTVDAMFAGVHTISGGGGTVTLTAAQSRNRIIYVTGVLSSNMTIVTPAGKARTYLFVCDATGGFTVSIQPSGGSALALPAPTIGVQVQVTASAAFLRHAGWNALTQGRRLLAAGDGDALDSTATTGPALFGPTNTATHAVRERGLDFDAATIERAQLRIGARTGCGQHAPRGR